MAIRGDPVTCLANKILSRNLLRKIAPEKAFFVKENKGGRFYSSLLLSVTQADVMAGSVADIL